MEINNGEFTMFFQTFKNLPTKWPWRFRPLETIRTWRQRHRLCMSSELGCMATNVTIHTWRQKKSKSCYKDIVVVKCEWTLIFLNQGKWHLYLLSFLPFFSRSKREQYLNHRKNKDLFAKFKSRSWIKTERKSSITVCEISQRDSCIFSLVLHWWY